MVEQSLSDRVVDVEEVADGGLASRKRGACLLGVGLPER